jgi:hypothetical protein
VVIVFSMQRSLSQHCGDGTLVADDFGSSYESYGTGLGSDSRPASSEDTTDDQIDYCNTALHRVVGRSLYNLSAIIVSVNYLRVITELSRTISKSSAGSQKCQNHHHLLSPQFRPPRMLLC